MTHNQIAYANYKETARHNLVSESVDLRNAAVNERNAAVNERNAETNFLNYVEGVRHNKETERIGHKQANAALSHAAAAHQANAIQAQKVRNDYKIGKANALINWNLGSTKNYVQREGNWLNAVSGIFGTVANFRR